MSVKIHTHTQKKIGCLLAIGTPVNNRNVKKHGCTDKL